MNYNICIPIPVKSANLSEIKPTLNKTIKKNPQFIELRFDYIDNVQTLSLDFIKELMNTINSNIPVIFTLRDSSEGGQIKISQKERFKILKMLVEAKPDYIDIEMNTTQNFLYEFINFAIEEEVKLILSYHNFEKTNSLDETIKLITNFNDSLIQNIYLKPKIEQKIIYKIVFTAHTFKDNIIPLKLCKYFSNFPQKLISFCMGSVGIFSRIMCVIVGSFLTYASLEEKTAPGQINIDKMKEIYYLFPNFL